MMRVRRKPEPGNSRESSGWERAGRQARSKLSIDIVLISIYNCSVGIFFYLLFYKERLQWHKENVFWWPAAPHLQPPQWLRRRLKKPSRNAASKLQPNRARPLK